VDDQKGIRLMIEEVLTFYGYQVITAAGGEEALELAGQVKPDLVLLDMKMPGLSGPETLARLRQEFPDLPVIMVTADEDSESWAKVKNLGVQGKINKPFDLQDLIKMLQQTLA